MLLNFLLDYGCDPLLLGSTPVHRAASLLPIIHCSKFINLLQFSGVAPPPLCRNIPQNGPNLSTVGADSLPKSTVNSTVQAPRRKVVDEGKLRKVRNI